MIKRLQTYHKKRDFTKTAEPAGKTTNGPGNTFVIQRHNASHLHYDLRLELNGVLKSWAVPKGMPKTYSEKHLAIQTEDHPLEYAKFEGIIPKGQYGGGTVKIWDSGTYDLLALKPDMFEFRLNGKRFTTCYALIRFKRDPKKNQWLLIKVKDKNK